VLAWPSPEHVEREGSEEQIKYVKEVYKIN
jgi:hypothetical protein